MFQMIEPKAVVHYRVKNVDHSFEQQLLIESFLDINGKKEHKDYQIFQYPAHHQRKVGCFGLVTCTCIFIQMETHSHVCFCQKLGIVDESIDNTIEKI